MTSWFNSVVLLGIMALAFQARGQDLVAPTEYLAPHEQQKKFRLPPGFEIQLVAAEPDINKPMNIAFDARGRLWVTSTIEYPYPARDGAATRDTVKVIEIDSETGRATRVTTFADGLNIPIGLLPIEGGALVHSIPNIWKLTDADGDGKADKKELFLGTYGFRDTHGMTNHFTVGFDGWVYANHGFSNDSEVRASDGSSIRMNSGNTYRFRLDGSRVEYWAHGQVNPFGLCFDPMGNLYSADCHSRPQYLLLRGAYYPSFGKPDDGLGFGPEMIDHDHGSTGIAGTMYYAADHFPQAYRGTIFNCNPVTNRINHDRLEWQGSSPRAIKQPDFVACDDPWFRPVGIVLGPDGAVYVNDFYNRIIGHYEVPLEHPGRDRTSGRIWRIVYRGEDGSGASPRIPDLSKASAAQLARALGSANLAVRMMASRQLVERVGVGAAGDVRRAFVNPASPEQAAQAMWALHRLGVLSEGEIDAGARNGSPLVRAHAMRVLSETPKVTAGQRAMFLNGLKDKDPTVRRAAADALGRHSAIDNIRPLLDVRRQTAPEDGHLIHTAKMALRDQLESSPVLAQLPQLQLTDEEQRLLAEVITAVGNPDAGSLILALLKKNFTDPAPTGQLLLSAARRLPPADVDSLAGMVLQRFPADLDLQRQLFLAMLDGLAQRGAAPGEATHTWGAELARKLIDVDPAYAKDWTYRPLDDSPAGAPNPWTPKEPHFSPAGTPVLWNSFPLGEQLTGALRSREFEIPAKLSFLISGHNGAPGSNKKPKNVVRLHLAGTDDVLVEALPPRQDPPVKVEWDLSKWARQRGYIEATDGDGAPSYAWLAFGRFDPPVVSTPEGSAEALRDRLVAATTIARALRLVDLRQRMEEVVADEHADPMARAGAARALGVMSTADSIKRLASVASDPRAPRPVREAVSQSLAEQNSPEGRAALLDAIAVAPEALQVTLAVALASGTEGGESLLQACAAGKASPRLLQDPTVRARLDVSPPEDLDARIKELTRNLPARDEALAKLIADRAVGFDPAKASPDRGKAVFQKNCQICHQIAGEGATIGPQLAGLAQRGVARLAEDLLDPNRNIDAAFRQTIVQLQNGDTVAGLIRREEGDLLILADSAGKEISVSKSKVKRQVPSALSLMPSNVGEIVTPEEFNDLIAFLLAN